MIVFLVKKYFVISLLNSSLIMFLGYLGGAFESRLETMVSSFFYSGTLSIFLIFHHFKSRQYWILYDNLMINKFSLLFFSYLLFLLITFSFSLLVSIIL